MRYTKKWLMRQKKDDLFFLCSKLNISTHEALNKSQLSEMIIEKQEENERLVEEEDEEVQRSVRIHRIYKRNKE